MKEQDEGQTERERKEVASEVGLGKEKKGGGE